MDPRRMNSAEVLASGVMSIPAPETDIPTDREHWDNSERDWSCPTVEEVIAALEVGKVVSASNYYGIPYVWREAEGVYRGTLLQYRRITANPTFGTASEAAEWFVEHHQATDG